MTTSPFPIPIFLVFYIAVSDSLCVIKAARIFVLVICLGTIYRIFTFLQFEVGVFQQWCN